MIPAPLYITAGVSPVLNSYHSLTLVFLLHIATSFHLQTDQSVSWEHDYGMTFLMKENSAVILKNLRKVKDISC